MYIIFAFLIELFLVVKVIHLYILCGFIFLYIWSYLDTKEYSGERHWPLFRNLVIWKWLSPIEYVLPHDVNGKRLYFVIPCATPIPLIWGIGLHGGQLQFKYTMHYIVPPMYLWLPIVRDILLWSGAVTYSTHNKLYSLQNVIGDLLDRGRSVVYCPSNFLSNTEDDLESQIHFRYPTNAILTMCRENAIQISPIIIQNEHLRYRVINHRWLFAVQNWFHSKLDSPLPLIYWMKMYNANKPPPLLVQFGTIITSNHYDGSDVLRQELRRTVDNLVVPILQDKSVKGN